LIYPHNFEQKIGFDKIRLLLEQKCLSSLGVQYVHKMKFGTDAQLIEKYLQQCAEFVHIINKAENFPQQYYYDITPYLQSAKIEGAFLDEEAFVQIKKSLATIAACIQFFASKENNPYPNLYSLTKDIKIDKTLIQTLSKYLDDHGKIRDDATPELRNVRLELINEQVQLRKNLDKILRAAKADGYTKEEDATPTIRNGRMVIPIAAEYKRKIKGLIHDESSTGQTVYIEPIEVFESNNRIKELEIEEKREIVKILTYLTSEIRLRLDDLHIAYRFLGLIDFIRAKALVSILLNAQSQQVVNKTLIDWKNTYNPILFLTLQENKKNIVPLNIVLEPENHLLVISGPNAGGKSVVLKTVALLQYMHQCGLPVPNGFSCKMGIFKDIFLDIGDEQSIENDLSTYSSHLANMKFFTEKANQDSLILIDEMGTGTDPQYGGAIAESILMHLTRKKVFGIVTTHYSNLKFFAENTQGVINGAMKYDYSNLSPLYELELGKPGNSFAIEIAQKIGLQQSIINTAKNKIGDKKINFDKLIRELNIEKQLIAEKARKLERSQKNLQITISQYEELKSNLENQKNSLLNQYKLEAKKIVAEAKAEAQLLIKQLKEQQKYDNKIIEEIKSKLQHLDARNKPTPDPKVLKNTDTKPLKTGDKVTIEGQEGIFKIAQIKGNEAELQIGELTTKVKLSRLVKVSGDIEHEKNHPALKKVKGIDINARLANFSSSIDIRGMRGEEALKEIDRWLDNALLFGASNLRILHGKGDGILRKLVREHLKRTPFVLNFKDEHVEFGGDGITLVTLK
jgi:DNA mismatch repair protein MutS2